jgi:hypothetical protein
MILEVSLGEAIDKLSILDIKCSKIKEEEKLFFVLQEKEYLEKTLNEIIKKYNFYYKSLLNTNLKIWDLQDILRNINRNDQNYAHICEDIINLNDSRFLIKNKINKLLNSKFQEQKGYKKRIAYFLGHLGLGDNITMSGLVRYLSFFYDEVYVFCKKRYESNLKLFYFDDPSIKTIPLELEMPDFNKTIKQYLNNNHCYELGDVFVSGGCHASFIKSQINHPFLKISKYVNNKHIKYEHINQFFKDINLDANIYHEYFYLPEFEESKKLYKSISEKYKSILFCHTVSSTKQININIDQYLSNKDFFVVNPNINMYNESDQQFDLANSIINLPLMYFIDIILNSDIIKIVDSSFCCIILPLSINDKLKCKNVEIFSR